MSAQPQPSLFDQPNPEIRARNVVLEDLAERRKEWLAAIREEMEGLYRERRAEWVHHNGLAPAHVMDPFVHVTADDARRAFEKMGPPPADILSRNFLGCVFRVKTRWRAIDKRHASSTPGSHGNALVRWALIEDES